MMPVLQAYRKPVLVITALNAATIVLIAVAWGFSSDRLGENVGSSRVSGVRKAPRCLRIEGQQRPEISSVELKARAARVFEAEKQNRTVEYAYLVALASALKFSQYDRVEELLNEYECGRTL